MELLLLAFALAMDSVALSIANGAKCRALIVGEVVKTAFVFGFFQALMPFLGYILGLAFVSFIASIDHFIAFGILAFLGVKMIKEAKEPKDEICPTKSETKFLIMGALATSIDALAVGITFSFVQINVLYACLIIGVVCFGLCVLAYYAGKFLGEWLEAKSLVLGGAILIFIGFKILLTHLGIV
ncbi:MAG: manganese efflux pump MntP family protein [Campylobacter sp.]|nr:manganese efflux pump MntP family protein [Campylobacter sp.]